MNSYSSIKPSSVRERAFAAADDDDANARFLFELPDGLSQVAAHEFRVLIHVVQGC